MRRTRGEANQSLYRARILLDAWEQAREAGRRPDEQLRGAFMPALRLHLRLSYGWFLLSVAGVEQSADGIPPRDTSQLNAPEPGKARAPELREFARLESSGWVADMLSDDREDLSGAAAPQSPQLLGSDKQAPGYAVARAWADALADIMARMDDSLAEC